MATKKEEIQREMESSPFKKPETGAEPKTPESVLAGAVQSRDKLKSIVVVGELKDGNFYFGTTFKENAGVTHLLLRLIILLAGGLKAK